MPPHGKGAPLSTTFVCGSTGVRFPLASVMRRSLALRISSGLLVLALAAGITLHFVRQPVDVAVRSQLPSPNQAVVVTGVTDDASQSIETELRALSVDSGGDRSGDSSDSQSRQVDVVIPIDASQCHRLAHVGDSGCGHIPTAEGSVAGGLTVEWPGGASGVPTSISFSGLSSIGLSHTAISSGAAPLTEWIARPSAHKTTVRFPCSEARPFTLVHAGRIVRGKCQPDGPLLSIAMAYTGGTEPTIAMSGLGSFKAQALGKAAKLAIDRGAVEVDGAIERPDGPDATTVEVRSSEPNGVSFVLRAASRQSELSVGAAAAHQFTVDGREKVPDLLSRHRDLWSQVVILLIGLFLGTWLDRLERSRVSSPR